MWNETLVLKGLRLTATMMLVFKLYPHLPPPPSLISLHQSCVWNETLVLKGLRLTATMMLVFELYLAKHTVAGLPTRENLVAWAYTSILTRGEVRGQGGCGG